MSETKHTPGPWHWVNSDTDEPFDFDAQWSGNGNPSLRTVKEYGENKTEVRDSGSYTSFALPKWILDADPMQNGNDAANARLIAAAPELLEMLIHVRDNVASDSPEMWRKVDEVIAKAIGVQP